MDRFKDALPTDTTPITGKTDAHLTDTEDSYAPVDVHTPITDHDSHVDVLSSDSKHCPETLCERKITFNDSVLHSYYVIDLSNPVKKHPENIGCAKLFGNIVSFVKQKEPINNFGATNFTSPYSLVRFCRIAFVIFLLLALFILNIILKYDYYTIQNKEIIYDALHDLTAPVNTWISANITRSSALIFIDSLAYDICFVLLWTYWGCVGFTFVLPLAFILFYAARAFVRILSVFPYPQGYVWHAPVLFDTTIPSLTIPYQPTDDFFFSGHVGSTVLGIVEFYNAQFWPGVVLSCIVVLLQFMVLLITRVHYVVDMITGAIIAHWLYLMSDRIIVVVTQYLPRIKCFNK